MTVLHPKVLLDVTKETRGEAVEFLDKVEQSGKWPQQACAAMCFFILKNVASERPTALMPTSVHWWEALRAPEVAKWQQSHCERRESRSVCFGSGQAFERVSLLVFWAWTTHFSFPRKILRVLCGYFEHQRRVKIEGCAAEPLNVHHGYPARVKVEMFASACCIAGSIE